MSRAVIDPYLKIQEALSDDKMDGVKANAGNLATANAVAAVLAALSFLIFFFLVRYAGKRET